MNTADWVNAVLAGLALFIAIYSLYRTEHLRKFDYATKLEIHDEAIDKGSVKLSLDLPMFDESLDDADTYEYLRLKHSKHVVFRYRAKLHNAGEKPIKINGIYMRYGHTQDDSRATRHSIEGRFYLGPEQTYRIAFALTKQDYSDALHRWGLDDLSYGLIVQYFTPSGTELYAQRDLGGARIALVQRGTILEPVVRGSRLNRIMRR